jgi:hypothetical protein
MPTWGITITEEMDAAVKEICEESGLTISNYVRRLVAQDIAQRGKKVDTKVSWGGRRKRKPKSILAPASQRLTQVNATGRSFSKAQQVGKPEPVLEDIEE